MIWKKWSLWRHFDYVLLATSLLLISYGIVMVYSATLADSPRDGSFFSTFPGHQAVFAVVGIALLVIFTAIDARLVQSAGYPITLAQPWCCWPSGSAWPSWPGCAWPT